MSETVQLYYSDSNLTEFNAQLLEVRERSEGVALVLDRTAFYPEGGGQPYDQGHIGGLRVTEVRKDGGTILHLVATADGLSIGQEISCSVDAERRRDYQQQHTGQHIISAAFTECGGHATVSVHQGEEYLTVEIESEEISENEISQVEQRANDIIEADIPVSTVWVTDAEIDAYPLRRRPKVSGRIRLVMVGDYDCVACGGVHVKRSGEVRLVHCIGVERIRGRVRTVWKTGDRALADYRLKSSIVRELVEIYSAPAPELISAVRAKLDAGVELSYRMVALERRVAEEAAKRLLREAAAADEQLLITAEFHGEAKGFLRLVADRVAAGASGDADDAVRGSAVCLVNHRENGEGMEWCIAVSQGVTFEFTAVRDRLFALIDGKGGGKSPLWQGAGKNRDAVPEFFDIVEQAIVRPDV